MTRLFLVRVGPRWDEHGRENLSHPAIAEGVLFENGHCAVSEMGSRSAPTCHTSLTAVAEYYGPAAQIEMVDALTLSGWMAVLDSHMQQVLGHLDAIRSKQWDDTPRHPGSVG